MESEKVSEEKYVQRNDSEELVLIETQMITSESERSLITNREYFAVATANFMSCYDFAVMFYFSDVVNLIFYPSETTGDSALIDFVLSIGCSYVFQPIGALLLGRLGDKYSKKKVIEIIILIYSVTSLGKGLLPSIGESKKRRFTIIAFTVLSSVRAFANGVQLTACWIYVCQNIPRDSRAYHGSFLDSAGNLGYIIGGLVAYSIKNNLSWSHFILWGWRIPFFIECTGICVFLYLWLYVPRTSAKRLSIEPIKATFRIRNIQYLLACFLVSSLAFCNTAITFQWLPIYMTRIHVPPIYNFFVVNTVSFCIAMILLPPLFGAVVDLSDNVKVMVIVAIVSVVHEPIAMLIFTEWHNSLVCGVLQLISGCKTSLYISAMFPFIIDLFPEETLMTSSSLAYTLSSSVFGSMTISQANFLENLGGALVPGICVALTAFFSLAGIKLYLTENISRFFTSSELRRPLLE